MSEPLRPIDYNGHVPHVTNEYLMWFNAGRSVGRLEQLADFGELTEAERDTILCLVMEFQNRPEAS